MSASVLLRSFVAYFDGISDSVRKNGVPTRVQWEKICARVAALRSAVEALPATEGAAAAAPAVAGDSTPEVDPVVGGATVTRKWKESVKRELEELGMDGESAAEAMRDKRFIVDLNADPKVYAAKIEAGVY